MYKKSHKSKSFNARVVHTVSLRSRKETHALESLRERGSPSWSEEGIQQDCGEIINKELLKIKLSLER